MNRLLVQILDKLKRNRILQSSCLSSVFIISYLLLDSNQVVHLHSQDTSGEGKPEKIILFWTKFFEETDFLFGYGRKPFVEAKCPMSNCRTTSDRRLFNQSQAILFHARDIHLDDLPQYRLPHQRFIFLNYESPSHSPLKMLHKLNNFFNWTMTYRRDSDIFCTHPYGRIHRIGSDGIGEEVENVLDHWNDLEKRRPMTDFSQKKKAAAWFVSNCRTPSRRERYVRQLAKYIDIDIYGNCGNFTCKDRTACYDMLKRDYRFYLSFENSLCPDYITEKFYYPMFHDVVPVVYGEADYKQFAPERSFINTADFESPEKLAEYLQLLMKNDSLYSSYFEWKSLYQVVKKPTDGWCELCRLLHNETLPKKTYSNVGDWWGRQAPCTKDESTVEPLLNIPFQNILKILFQH